MERKCNITACKVGICAAVIVKLADMII